MMKSYPIEYLFDIQLYAFIYSYCQSIIDMKIYLYHKIMLTNITYDSPPKESTLLNLTLYDLMLNLNAIVIILLSYTSWSYCYTNISLIIIELHITVIKYSLGLTCVSPDVNGLSHEIYISSVSCFSLYLCAIFEIFQTSINKFKND